MASEVLGASAAGSVTFCSVVVEASALVSLAIDSVVPVFAAESTEVEAFESTTIASDVFEAFVSTVFWLSVIGDVVGSIEVEALVINSREFALEEEEVDLKFVLTDLDLAADFMVGLVVGLDADLSVILAVAQFAVWSEALECQQKK